LRRSGNGKGCGGKGRRRFERKEGEWKVNGIEEKQAVEEGSRDETRRVCTNV